MFVRWSPGLVVIDGWPSDQPTSWPTRPTWAHGQNRSSGLA